MKKCMKCGKKDILYYIGNDTFASPIYVCKDCKLRWYRNMRNKCPYCGKEIIDEARRQGGLRFSFEES